MLPNVISLKRNNCSLKELFDIHYRAYYAIIIISVLLALLNLLIILIGYKKSKFSNKRIILNKTEITSIIESLCKTEIIILIFESVMLSTDITLRSSFQISNQANYKIQLAFILGQVYSLNTAIESIFLFTHFQLIINSKYKIKAINGKPIFSMSNCYLFNMGYICAMFIISSFRIIEFSVIKCCNLVSLRYGDIEYSHMHHIIFALFCVPALFAEICITFITLVITFKSANLLIERVLISLSYIIMLFYAPSLLSKIFLIQFLDESDHNFQDLIIFVELLQLIACVLTSIGFLSDRAISLGSTNNDSQTNYYSSFEIILAQLGETKDPNLTDFVSKENLQPRPKETATYIHQEITDQIQQQLVNFKLRRNSSRGSFIETSEGYTNSLFETKSCANDTPNDSNVECVEIDLAQDLNDQKGEVQNLENSKDVVEKISQAELKKRELRNSKSVGSDLEKNIFPFQRADKSRRYSIVSHGHSRSSVVSRPSLRFNSRLSQTLNKRMSVESDKLETKSQFTNQGGIIYYNYDFKHPQRNSCISYKSLDISDVFDKNFASSNEQPLFFHSNNKSNDICHEENLNKDNCSIHQRQSRILFENENNNNNNNNSIRKTVKRPSTSNYFSDSSDKSEDSYQPVYSNCQRNNSGRKGSCCSQTALLGNTLVVLTREKVFRRIQPIEKAGRRVGESRYQV